MNLREECTQIYVAFGLAYRELLKSQLGLSDLPKISVKREVFTENGTEDRVTEELNTFKIYDVGDSDIAQLSELKACVEVHLEHGVIPRPTFTRDDGQVVENPKLESVLIASLFNWLRWPFFHSIQTARTLNFSNEHLAKSYGEYFDTWTSRTLAWVTRVPLLGFRCDIDEFELTPGFSIRRLDNRAKDDFGVLQYFSLYREGLTAFDLIRATHEIVLEYETKKGHKRKDIGSAIRPLIAALRLYGAGQVGVRSHLTKTQPDLPHIVGSLPQPLSGLVPGNLGTELRLGEGDVNPLKAMFAQVSSLRKKKDRGLLAGLRRFNLSYEKGEPEDKLLDLVIALDCTLLHGLKNELSYRCGLRGAYLLRESCPIQNTASMIQLLYEARSRIVHDGISVEQIVNGKYRKKLEECSGETDLTEHKVLALAENLCRNVLKSLISLSSNGDALDITIQNIDRAILAQLSQT